MNRVVDVARTSALHRSYIDKFKGRKPTTASGQRMFCDMKLPEFSNAYDANKTIVLDSHKDADQFVAKYGLCADPRARWTGWGPQKLHDKPDKNFVVTDYHDDNQVNTRL